MSDSLSLFYAVQEVADALDERMVPIVTSAELTLPQFHLLYLVVEEGPMRLGELARYRRCVKSNVSNLVRAMERQALVELKEDRGDRRARVVHATSEGMARYRRARREAARLERQVRKALGDTGGQELAKLCLAAAQTMDSSE